MFQRVDAPAGALYFERHQHEALFLGGEFDKTPDYLGKALERDIEAAGRRPAAGADRPGAR